MRWSNYGLDFLYINYKYKTHAEYHYNLFDYADGNIIIPIPVFENKFGFRMRFRTITRFEIFDTYGMKKPIYHIVSGETKPINGISNNIYVKNQYNLCLKPAEDISDKLNDVEIMINWKYTDYVAANVSHKLTTDILRYCKYSFSMDSRDGTTDPGEFLVESMYDNNITLRIVPPISDCSYLMADDMITTLKKIFGTEDVVLSVKQKYGMFGPYLNPYIVHDYPILIHIRNHKIMNGDISKILEDLTLDVIWCTMW